MAVAFVCFPYVSESEVNMKFFFRFFRKKRVQTVLAPLFKLAEAVFELLVPIFVAQIIDVGIGQNNLDYIWTRCLILVALGVCGLGFSVASQYMSATVATSFAADLRNEAYKKINALSFSDVDKQGTEAVITRMTSDVDRLQHGVNMTLRLLLRSPFIVFGALVGAFLTDAIGATVFACAIPVLLAIVFAVLLGGIRLYRKSQSGLEEVTLLTSENVTGVRVIRAFGLEEKEEKKFEEKNALYAKAQRNAGLLSALMNPLTYAVINCGVIALLYLGGIRVNSGKMTSGQVVALYNYLSQILVELIKLANLVITLSRAGASGKRVKDLLLLTPSQTFPEQVVTETDEEVVVRFKNVSLSYNGAANALEDVSFLLKKGRSLGILGGTGSGKSTLLQLIPRFYDATEGEITVNGINVKEYPKEQLRNKIAMVMQKPFLMSGTIEENVAFDEKDDEKMHFALNASQAEDVVASKKGGLQEPVLRGGNNFSGGQKQRLSIARALYKDADILLFDDATSALDALTEKKVLSAVRGLQKTVVATSQRANSVKDFDEILVLDEGKVVGRGTHESLLDNCPLYKEIFNLQNGEDA